MIRLIILWTFCFLSFSCKESDTEITPYLTCEKEKIVFNNSELMQSINCETNIDKFSFSFDNGGEKWCTAEFDNKNELLILNVQKNEGMDIRTTQLTVNGQAVKSTIEISQTGITPTILLAPKTARISASGGSVTTEVTSNIKFDQTISQPSWIKAGAVTGNTRQFNISLNNSTSTREGNVIFHQTGGAVSDTFFVVQEGNKYTARLSVPFGYMGFIEPLENSTYAKKTAQGIREWNNGETIIKFFVNVAGTPLPDDSLFMQLKGSAYEKVNLKVKINDSISKIIAIPAGKFTVDIPAYVPLKSNYQCISFQGQDGNKHYPDLDSMVIRHRPGLALNYNTTNYGAPAVHLSYSADSKNVEWSMGEVMIKPEACRPDMYYMVSGFNGGYSGIQVSADFDINAPRGNTFLFSVWSDFDTQNPSEIPDDYQPWTDEIRKGEDMRDEGFGNEGSGVHANWYYKWKPNVIYKFLIHQEDVGTVRRNGKNYPNCKAYTCWMHVPELGGWHFYVRYIRPNDTRTSLGLPGSFVENPSGTHSSSKYRGYYRHWVRYQGASAWTPLQQAGFSTTGANADHPRYDVGIGHETIHDENNYGGDFCYIFSGGFTVNTGRNVKNPTLNISEIPDVDLTKLPSLELFDNLMSGDTQEGVEKADRTGWTATASSEETSGPYEKGYAGYAIDGNTGTFWHSQYSGGKPNYPHWVCIDMLQEQQADGCWIQPRGKDVAKDFTIEISNNNTDWTTVGNYSLENNGSEQKFKFPERQNGRYLRITLKNGHNTATAYTSISEIGIFRNK